MEFVALAAVDELMEQHSGKQVQHNPLRAGAGNGFLAGPGGLAREHLLLLDLPLDNLVEPFDAQVRSTYVKLSEEESLDRGVVGHLPHPGLLRCFSIREIALLSGQKASFAVRFFLILYEKIS